TDILPMELMLPAVGQGALALEARAEDAEVQRIVKAIDHADSHLAAIAERSFLRVLGGSCQTPIGAFAEIKGTRMVRRGMVVPPQGPRDVRHTETGPAADAKAIGERLAKHLLANGADKILQ